VAAVMLSALVGCSGGSTPSPTPSIVAADAYPVINTFLVALEAADAAAIDPTIQNDAQIDGVPRSEVVAAELATHGGLQTDYDTITTNIGEDLPDTGQFRARLGDPDHRVTLEWMIKWKDGRWYVDLPPRLLAPARIG
jgi:hypothetical protein